MAYSSIAKPTDYFNTVLWTGNGSTMTITGVGFNADLVWVKLRSGSDDNRLFDQVRGINKYVISNSNSTETTDAILSTNSDGYNLASAGEVTANGGTFVGWNWKANGAGSSNSDGTIASTVSVNTTAGFSIVSYVGGGASSATVGHGLGTTPAMIIIKNRQNDPEWRVWHQDLSGSTYKLRLNGTEAQDSSATVFNGQSATTFTVGNDPSVSGSGNNIIAYCFKEVKGYSKFGSYTGNGNANGAFVYTGFKPAFTIFKRSSGTGGWIIHDNKRSESDGNNTLRKYLVAQTNGAEGTDDFFTIDHLSNGFKLRATDGESNASGSTYIYMAFAENPFVGNVSGTAVPVTAR